MPVKTGQIIKLQFNTSGESGLVDADSLPSGVLVIDGANDAATVTISNISTGLYSAEATLPTLTAGKTVQLRIVTIINGITDASIIFTDTVWDIIDVNVVQVDGVDVDLATEFDANLIKVNGVNVSTSNEIDANIVKIDGVEIDTDVAQLGVNVVSNNDKTGYGLADDAITAAKFDESTAFPLKSADTGITQVARKGDGSHTLETINDQVEASAFDYATNPVIVGTNNDKTGYGLADDAITAAKFDESTAFPLKSADIGITEIARKGDGSHTLETINDQVEASAFDYATNPVIVGTNNDKTGYGLADDAITAAKFDESTAFPLRYVDSGITEIARKGTGSHTLETLNDNVEASAFDYTTNPVIVGTNNDKTGYGLADDTITADKFDESTAFPLKSADTGITEIARKGTGLHTLETLESSIGVSNFNPTTDPVIVGANNDKVGYFLSGTKQTLDDLNDLSAQMIWEYSDRTMTSGILGAGAIEWTYNLLRSDTGLPIPEAKVWVTTDAPGANVVASSITDAYGNVTFYLDAGTVYIWVAKTGFSFTNPDMEVVS